MSFTEKILSWHKTIDRQLPWKKTNDPYKIWISEIVLQQTRVQQGTKYYLSLVDAFPTVYDLADAEEDVLLRLWKGLGYYSRARNMHKAAKIIVEEYNGIFPDSKELIERLPGIGPYTSAAISSFAYGVPHAVVDGNVYRVLSRMYGIFVPINSTTGKKEFASLAQDLLDQERPAAYNQAIMDFGALCCRPKNPDCMFCPTQDICKAYQQGIVHELPKKEKMLKRRRRYFIACVSISHGKVLIEKRLEKDVWRGLYTTPLIECEFKPDFDKAKEIITENINVSKESISYVLDKKQKLTHQDVHVSFYSIQIGTISSDQVYIDTVNYEDYAMPRLIDEFLIDFLEME